MSVGGPAEKQLVRALTPVDAIALVVGTVIGTGIFLKAATVSQDVGTPGLVLAAWIAAGVLSLAGALTYAELGALIPLSTVWAASTFELLGQTVH